MIEIRERQGGLSFLVRVQPRSSRNEIDGEWRGALCVRLNVPPVEGRANEALRRFLADCLNVPLAAVKIASGQRGRLKRIEVLGGKAEQIRAVASWHAKNHMTTIGN
jgi:uncharacterized protein (TIGR00251 family)